MTASAGARVVELRIHGVGGSTAEKILGSGPCPLTADADETSGFWRSQPSAADDGRFERRAYLWGHHRPSGLGLWLFLLPFTLVNAAGWAISRGTPTPEDGGHSGRRRFAARASRRLIALVGLSLTVTWTLWMAIVVADSVSFSGLGRGHLPLRAGVAIAIAALVAPALASLIWGIRRGSLVFIASGFIATAALGNSAGGNRTRAMLALGAAAMATAVPFVLAGVNRLKFEQYRARLGGTGIARERRRLSDEETLASPCFFDHPTEGVGLLLAHAFTAVAILGVLAVRAWQFGGLQRPDIVAPGSAHVARTYLGPAFLYVGAVQFGLMIALLVTASIGTSPDRAGSRFTKNPIVKIYRSSLNALRAPTMAGIGVFLFTALIGSIDALMRPSVRTVLRDGNLSILTQPELELMPAYLFGATVALILSIVIGIAVYQASSPPDCIPSELRRAWRWDRTLRRFVESLDRLVAMTGVLIFLALLSALYSHRVAGGGWSFIRLTPNEHLTALTFWERWVGHAVPVLGLFAVVIPFAMALLARWRPVRQGLATLWDVLGFWPRRFHPLGVPPKAERAVPELQSHLLETLEKAENRVLIVAHSQGSVIAFGALAGLRDRDALARIGLVTCGSPLFALYPRMFPAQVEPHLIDELARDLQVHGPRWMAISRPTDFFGSPPVAGADDFIDKLELRTASIHPLPTPEDGGEARQLLAHNAYFGANDVEGMVADRVDRLRDRVPPTGMAALLSFAPRRRMVSWFDPRLLALTAYQAAVSSVFGRWADARKTQSSKALPGWQRGYELRAEGNEVWVDFVADLGDGFEPTFSVAHAVAQEELHLPVSPVSPDSPDAPALPRGHVLIFGGDEIYPFASRPKYENQLVGPYSLAARCVSGWSGSPLLFAIPGNHDWYDGLQSFEAFFCTGQPIGPWQTRQHRSYWSVRLTAPGQQPAWWVWGVDLQLDNRFDLHQREYFHQQAELLSRGDHVILCSPIPTWAHAGADPTAFDALRDLVQEEVDRRHARVVLHLSGDLHHYARYERFARPLPHATTEPDAQEASPAEVLPVQHITAGGGGAFTHPTHGLPQTVELPVAYDAAPLLVLRARRPEASRIDHPSEVGSPFQKNRSRQLLRSLVWFIPRNRGFLLVPAIACGTATVAAALDQRDLSKPIPSFPIGQFGTRWLQSALTLLVCALVVLGWTLFAKPSEKGSKAVAKGVGFAHGGVQVAAMFWAGWISAAVLPRAHSSTVNFLRRTFGIGPIAALEGVLARLTLGVFSAALGGAVGCMLLAGYLWWSNRLFHMHQNEAASAVASTDHKHFVRICIRGGVATCWVIGVRVDRKITSMFGTHDPRPREAGVPTVELWDRFEVGRQG